MTETKKATPYWRQMALPASIVLNLFLLALIGGHLWHLRRAEVNSGTPLARALARAEARLPPRDAAAFAAVIRRDEPHYRDDQKRLIAARQDLARAIAAEPFSADGVRRALAIWRTAWNGFFDDFSGTLIDALSKVSPEGRRELVPERRGTREQRSPADQ
ncbi:MAG TPA: periplasmic heavy metal sensor [Stellaceae bacterium]|nr:periplasmic heavy metal sensor [Stellaceae bacterium]